MPEIRYDSPIAPPPGRVFAAVSEPSGLDAWWTRRAAGRPEAGAEDELWFGPEDDWRGTVTRCVPDEG